MTKGRCDDGFILNSSICEWEYDKSCDVEEYSDYENCKYSDKLVEECSKDINGNEIIYNMTLYNYEKNASLVCYT